MRCAILGRCTLNEPEVADTRAPVEAGRRRVVLVCVVKRAVIHRIDCDIAVIAPAIGSGTLAARPIEKMLLTGQRIQCVRRQAACVTNLRVNRTAGRAKAEGNVALVIGGDAAHPAPGGVWLVRALLEDCPAARLCPLQFKPADTCHRAGTDRVIVKQRFMTVGEAAIGVAEHQAIANRIEPGAGAELGDAVPRCRTKRSKRSCTHADFECEG